MCWAKTTVIIPPPYEELTQAEKFMARGQTLLKETGQRTQTLHLNSTKSSSTLARLFSIIFNE